MNRIANAFERDTAFIAFLTAGDPNLAKTEEYILAMAEAGADLVEIGIPFSDPVAEGEVIQRATLRALAAGTTPQKIFELVRRVRAKTDVPLVFLTYMNPIFNYGADRFFAACKDCGVDGVIIPDLPLEERGEVEPAARKYGVARISLVAPSSAQRIDEIARQAEGFVYCVSSLGVTGVRQEIATDVGALVAAIRREAKVPVAVGFGIATPEQAAAIGKVADGVIVGSAIVRRIEQYGENAAQPLADYVRAMKTAMS